MKKLLSLVTLSVACSLSLPALAQTEAVPAKPTQQTRMGACSKDATGKKGDERKAFMKECLTAKSGKSAKSEAPAQPSKTKTCHLEAKGKKGNERKIFMKECLGK